MFSRRLKSLRGLTRLTQAELSERLGIERTRYTKRENGVSEPS